MGEPPHLKENPECTPVYVCRSKLEADLRAQDAFSCMHNGRFVALMANTCKERTWMAQKKPLNGQTPNGQKPNGQKAVDATGT